MTEAEFTALALALPDAEASSHMGQPDFRVRGKIFATTGYEGAAVLKLTPDQQDMLIRVEPAVFERVPNAWGAKGWTRFMLASGDVASARGALATAWRNIAPKSLIRAHPDL